MKYFINIVFAVFALTVAGCSDSSGNNLETDISDITEISNQTDLVRYLDNSVYQSEQDFEIGMNTDGETMGKWQISFSDGQFDWVHSDTSEQGSYSYTDTNTMMVTLDNTSFEARIDPINNSLEWMEVNYLRTVSSDASGNAAGIAISSQSTLVQYLNNSVYVSEIDYEAGNSPQGEVTGKWTITFSNEQLSWAYSDTIEQGSYAYINENTMMVTLNTSSFEVQLDPIGHELIWMEQIYLRTDQQE